MEERERYRGHTNFTFAKMLSLWMNGLTAFSIKPLRLASFIGVAIAFAGFVYGLSIVIRKIFCDNIAQGYSSIMAVILFVDGIIMVLLGLIGEYLGRIYMCINESPQFVIKEMVNFEEE
jgi:undecaprenyl-phosphate 4-deoxy-4-formamido-L-arabinose transferase